MIESPGPIGWNLKQLAIFIAVLAVSFAMVGVGSTVVGLVVCSPILFVRPGRKLAAAFWVTTCYPTLAILSLYSTCFFVWMALGHPPRPSLDDPKLVKAIRTMDNLTGLLLFGCPATLAIAIGLMVTLVVRTSRDEHPWPSRSFLVFSVPFVYLACAGFFLLDPFGVLSWIMD